jgi:hypothetical protein
MDSGIFVPLEVIPIREEDSSSLARAIGRREVTEPNEYSLVQVSVNEVMLELPSISLISEKLDPVP